MLLLEVKNLHVEIDAKKILNGLDLTIEKGKVHASMGPNGSGKSTLAYVLAGKTDYQLTAGEVLFDGEDLHAAGRARRARHPLFATATRRSFELPWKA
jgi:Fe-S cluster assembly ATP-binding protein